MALPATLGSLRASFAVDTGATVNVLSEKAYRELQRTSRGDHWPLVPSDLHLVGVANDPLNVLGKVCLPIKIGKHSPIVHLDFYVTPSFSLPSDGILGLSSMKSHNMSIYPNHNTLRFSGRSFKTLRKPRSLISSPTFGNSDQDVPVETAHVPIIHSLGKDESVSESKTSNSFASTPECNGTPNTTINILGQWQTVKATVVGSHTIPDRTAMSIPVSVVGATVGCDICIEGPSQVQRLSVEPILSTVREGNQAVALVVNQTGASIQLKQGVYLSQALAYNGKVEPKPLEMPTTTLGVVQGSSVSLDSPNTKALDALVSVGDYPELKSSLLQLMTRYRDVIALPGEPLGATEQTMHHIKVNPGTSPVYIPAYRLPHSQRQIVDDQVEDMLKQGVIQHSTSPWNSPLFLVPKKDGTHRPVIDFREVNKVTETDRFPLPLLQDILRSLGHGNQIFSTLDLLSGYWQVPMAPDSREITAFSTPSGHFEWLRMPFGLKNAPITFQRMINTIFSGMIGNNFFAYLDDLIVCSKDAESHFHSLETVFQKLRDAGLKAKLVKCEFLKSKISFLGHTVDAEGIHTADDKVLAVKNFPQPGNVENVRSFLGLVGYYRSFISHFAAIASPLTQLLKKNVTFHWHAAQEKSFLDLKHALTNAPILSFPNYEAPFELCTDASSLGLGAVLMQKDDHGKNRAVAYASRTLTPAESNYSVTHLETLAIVWALKYFRDMIFGYSITVFTDHAPVTEIFKGRNLSGRLARWYLTIQAYNPTFKYLPGRANVVADALSRNVPIGTLDTTPAVIQNFSLHDLAQAQRQHHLWRQLIYALESGDQTGLPQIPVPFQQFFLTSEGVLCRYWPTKREPVAQYVIPESYVPTVLNLVHDTVVAGHPGKERTLTAARRHYFWPTMLLDVNHHVAKCVKCAQNKGTVSSPAPILEYPPPAKPWDVVSIDLLQLPHSRQGSKYLLVCVDHFSRFVVLAPLRDKTARCVAHALVSSLFCPYSTPRVILSDNGAEFRNHILSEICTQFNIQQSFIMAYHPASNGLCERSNRKVLEALRPVVSGLVESWEDWLPHVAASVNSNVCVSTGQSPHFIVYGHDKRLPYDLLATPQQPVYNVEDYATAQRKVFSDIYREVHQNLVNSKVAMSKQQHKRASPVTLQVGDSVMVKVPERSSKLAPKFLGPRLITRHVHGNKFEVHDARTDQLEVIHCDRLKKTDARPEAVPTPTSGDIPSSSVNNSSLTPGHTYNLRPRP